MTALLLNREPARRIELAEAHAAVGGGEAATLAAAKWGYGGRPYNEK